MDKDRVLALRIVLVFTAVVVVFLTGAWWGSRNQVCLTVDLPPYGTTVACQTGMGLQQISDEKIRR